VEWQWSPIEWILGCFSIASVALFLLDRAHRSAIKEMRDSCTREQSDMQRRIDELQRRLGIRGTE
jgi:hypothetical protein